MRATLGSYIAVAQPSSFPWPSHKGPPPSSHPEWQASSYTELAAVSTPITTAHTHNPADTSNTHKSTHTYTTHPGALSLPLKPLALPILRGQVDNALGANRQGLGSGYPLSYPRKFCSEPTSAALRQAACLAWSLILVPQQRTPSPLLLPHHPQKSPPPESPPLTLYVVTGRYISFGPRMIWVLSLSVTSGKLLHLSEPMCQLCVKWIDKCQSPGSQ